MFNSELIQIVEDAEIQEYFKINKINIHTFVKKYIKVDRILNATEVSEDSIFNKIDDMQKNIMLKIECLKNENKSNEEIKMCINNLTYKINNEINTNIRSSFENNHKLIKIDQTLESIKENFSTNSARKGQMTETLLINMLRDALPDTEVNDMSNKANSGDIHLVRDNLPIILIDSKNFGNNTVPKRDIDKFYRDIQENNCCGILCNTFGGIANKQNFEIDIVDNNIMIFIHSHKFEAELFKMAVNIIYNMHNKIKKEDKNSGNVIIKNESYQNLKIEYNYYIQSFRHHLDIIKANVNSLSQLSFTLLDAFFKRRAVSGNSDKKPYTCHICATSVSTEKILKVHMKKQHSDRTF